MLRRRYRRKDGSAFLDHLAGAEGYHFELQRAGLSFGVIENIVQHGRQPARGAFEFFHIVALFGVQIRPGNQAAHAEHAIQRRPNLMAHIREKFGLVPVGGLGFD